VYNIVIIVGKSLHIIEDDPINYKYRKAFYKLTCDGRQKKKRINYCNQYNLIGFKTDKKIG
jgi:hypothetical protein